MRTSPGLLLVATLLAACAQSSSPQGTQDGATDPVDASDEPDATADEDASPIDAPPIDGPAIDAPAIDASPIDGAVAIDAAPPDATPPDAMPPDANTCPTSPCDLVEQCGCSTTQACDIDFTDLDGTACRGITVAGDENDTCTSVSQCDAGYVCLGGSGTSSCTRYCDDDADCGTPRGQCVLQIVDDMQQPIPGAVACSSNCDPANTTNAACPSGWSCDLYTATFQEHAARHRRLPPERHGDPGPVVRDRHLRPGPDLRHVQRQRRVRQDLPPPGGHRVHRRDDLRRVLDPVRGGRPGVRRLRAVTRRRHSGGRSAPELPYPGAEVTA